MHLSFLSTRSFLPQSTPTTRLNVLYLFKYNCFIRLPNSYLQVVGHHRPDRSTALSIPLLNEIEMGLPIVVASEIVNSYLTVVFCIAAHLLVRPPSSSEVRLRSLPELSIGQRKRLLTWGARTVSYSAKPNLYPLHISTFASTSKTPPLRTTKSSLPPSLFPQPQLTTYGDLFHTTYLTDQARTWP